MERASPADKQFSILHTSLPGNRNRIQPFGKVAHVNGRISENGFRNQSFSSYVKYLDELLLGGARFNCEGGVCGVGENVEMFDVFSIIHIGDCFTIINSIRI